MSHISTANCTIWKVFGGLNCTIWKVSVAWMNVRCRELSVNFVDGSCGAIRPLYPPLI